MSQAPTFRKKQKSPKPLSHGETAYNKLKQAIRDGSFEPGQPIRESKVAAWLKVSRTPVRDAIRRLQNEGILSYSRLHDGVTLSALDREDVLNIYAVREILEGAAAGLAARHAREIEIEALRDLLKASRATKDPEQLAQVNYRFHAGIHQAARNPYLSRMITVLRESLALLGPPTTFLPGRPNEDDKAHAEILAMLEKQDAAGADLAMRAHVRSALARRFQLLEQPIESYPDITYPMFSRTESGKPRSGS